MDSARISQKGGVSPFGHPRINDRSHLPAAFRSVPRPSSPLGAKASTGRPYHAPAKTTPADHPSNNQPPTNATQTKPNAAATDAHRCRRKTRRTMGEQRTDERKTAPSPSRNTSNPNSPVKEQAAAAPGENPPGRGGGEGFRRQASRQTPAARGHDARTTRMHARASQPAAGLEAIGFEPTTPCLQSRCSPS